MSQQDDFALDNIEAAEFIHSTLTEERPYTRRMVGQLSFAIRLFNNINSDWLSDIVSSVIWMLVEQPESNETISTHA